MEDLLELGPAEEDDSTEGRRSRGDGPAWFAGVAVVAVLALAAVLGIAVWLFSAVFPSLLTWSSL
ncbi:hypothetical protein [Umezawaea beigongshangensis]|uniref:hypothetical protein n=1 Tax=Umezawaea beigongshangensis TaxID=2780383 RepID=UPI0018F20D25|nr:hypothetical protein [Umezawaea beigongshangensis]